MKLSKSILLAAVICCAICVVLSVVAVAADEIAYARIDPYNRMALCLDGYHNIANWAFLLYDLVHLFVIAIFALALSETVSWEALLGGGVSMIATLSDIASVSVNVVFLTPGLQAMALGSEPGLSAPEAGYDVITSTLDFAQASFGLVGTLFLGTAAIKAPGISKFVGWYLLASLPIGFLQFAEVGLRQPWTLIIDTWVTPVSETIEQVLIGLVLLSMVLKRPREVHSAASAGSHKRRRKELISSREETHKI
jgi:hypothetical protein